MDETLGQPLPRTWTFLLLLVVVPAVLLLPPGLLAVGDGGSRTVLGVCLIAIVVGAVGAAAFIGSTGVLVGQHSISRTFAGRVVFTIPLDRVERVEVRQRYGGAQISAWSTLESGRRVAVYASPLIHATTRPLLDALRPYVDSRPELLPTPDDREGYAYAVERS